MKNDNKMKIVIVIGNDRKIVVKIVRYNHTRRIRRIKKEYIVRILTFNSRSIRRKKTNHKRRCCTSRF